LLSIIQEYNNHLEEIFENSYDYIYLHDKAGNILDVNEVVVKNLGYSKQEILSMNATDFLSIEENIVEIQGAITETVQTGKVKKPRTYTVKKKDENLIYIEVNTIPLKRKGEIYAILGIGHDVTEFKKVEQKLIESEEKYRFLSENTDDLIVVYNEDLSFSYTNEATHERILGYSMDELRTLSSRTSLIHEDDINQHGEAFQEGFRKGKFKHQLRIRHKDGHILWFETKGRTFIDKYGNTKLLAVSRDITDIKGTELELIESEEKFRTIAEQSLMGIIILQDGVYKYFNKAVANIIGYTVDEIQKWEAYEFKKFIFPDDSEFVMEQARKKQLGEPDVVIHYQYRIKKKNGLVIWVDNYSKTINYKGKPADFVMIIDINEKIEAEQLIIEENKRLLELHELRKDIITRVSHELKTPMTSIYGAIQILTKLDLEEISEEAQKYVEIGHRGCLRLKELIDNLLDVSRLDAKKLELKLQKENLVEIIVDCVKDMKYLATNRQLKMILELPEEIYIDIDKLRFRQVLSNIILNAIKNTPKEGNIFITLDEKSDYTDIHIKDTGIGLTEKEKEKLFGKFGKIERYGMDLGVDIEGSGLGLYISKEIVDLHGGQILVESEGRNKGSTFTIRLFKK